MKRTLLLLISFALVLTYNTNAQEFISDDFESYTIGQGVAAQSSDWNTWSGAAGGSEDPVISDAYANGGTKSLKISGTNDAVIKLNDRSEGRYFVEFYMFVPSGRQAYFNLLQKFTVSGVGTIWGTQLYIKNGTVTIDGAGSAAASTTYTQTEWIKFQLVVDLDSDWIEVYVNDQRFHAYQWSKGCFDEGTSINRLDAVNFYAWDEGGTPEYYIDDIVVTEIDAPPAPLNLSYVLENNFDVKLTWEAPETETPESYIISRGGIEVATVDNTTLTYTDVHVYPDSYLYTVYANYGALGSSDNSATVDVVIPGSIARNYVLYEIFTGTWCQYCPIAARAIDQVAANSDMDVAIIEYHGGDSYQTNATSIREAFYSNAFSIDIGYPASITSGMYVSSGALPTVADQKSYYDALYSVIKPKSSIYRLDTDIELTGSFPYTFDLNIEIEELASYYSGDIKLFVVLTETNIAENWQTLSEVNFVVRNVYPNANGSPLDFSTESVINRTVQVTIPSGSDVNKCELVTFVQLMNSESSEILQVSKNKLSSSTAAEEQNFAAIQVYPNPADDILNIASENNIDKIEVVNITGQTVDIANPNADNYILNTSGYNSGIYFVKIYSADKITNHKITIQ
ncbi:MAG: T9SS type A sorting domain-containing protein [Bacteroidales bacterium]|jgi:thiol-disulfide isomerase/thioredoxin|nr:T9SS type A sorting domain-containing protein [Bacteroidales bacterium]